MSKRRAVFEFFSSGFDGFFPPRDPRRFGVKKLRINVFKDGFGFGCAAPGRDF